MGRLGNQMFQYASLMGIARKHDYEFIIPPPTGDKSLTGQFKVDHLLLEAFDLSNLKYIGWSRSSKQFKEDQTKRPFDEDLFNNCEDESDIAGYFQSEKYFEHIKNEVLTEFKFKSEIEEQAKNEIKRVGENIISLHVRRTDYLEDKSSLPHPMKACDFAYYIEALNYFDNSRPVLIFSDEIDWCKKWFTGDRFFFSENKTNILDMCLMTNCLDHIIANSSFSWWGAYLGKNNKKTVISPKKWFSFNDRDDMIIVPSDWIRL